MKWSEAERRAEGQTVGQQLFEFWRSERIIVHIYPFNGHIKTAEQRTVVQYGD